MERLQNALRKATDALLAEINEHGHWTGELSSSALSTATAVVALKTIDGTEHTALVEGGIRWLQQNQNADGGWGDTTRSKSNISTTALCWAALAGTNGPHTDRAEAWLGDVRTLPDRIAARYGKDRTFSVPILMTLAISGRLGADGWRRIPKLPFELAAVPHWLWGAIRLPVVSYAMPALIAIGQAIQHHAPSWNPLRPLAKSKTLRVLATLQPENGGFLEATPLTSFVTMALASCGLGRNIVARRGVSFLRASVRPDGSWPIDTNLATWATTLAVKALAHQPGALKAEQRLTIREWLLGQQWNREHPYTHAAPGGWAWTDLPGGVPDADDTPGALLALLRLGLVAPEIAAAGAAGVKWLLGLQNRDGGIPTFCRGWGALPFDRSSPDLTAHTIRAWREWQKLVPSSLNVERGIAKARAYLIKQQQADGSWLPLWFGNEHLAGESNPLYGTAHVTAAFRELGDLDIARRGEAWIAAAQNADGGWGGGKGAPSSVEETALAVEALALTSHTAATQRGVDWLCERVENGTWREPAPIGFYFAKLWYYERLYPLVWTVGALGKVAKSLG
ncbi:MAG: Squalene--hopene cyclase [Verrucomicrobiota bacterium]|jgi:squalene-hopene/tetraprenyl-beta-curcumene cyclase